MKQMIFLHINLLLMCNLLFGQETIETAEKTQERNTKGIPAQAMHSNKFKIKNVSFNKRIDKNGKGEILEVEFVIKNQIDPSMDLYIFVIATNEKIEKTTASFEMPIIKMKRIRSFVPYPDDKKNYEYPNPEKKGETILLKYPKNKKAGVNPKTGKPYHLTDQLFIRTYHLSKYRNNYLFFNDVAILIFDENGKQIFRQLYKISGKRR